MTSKLNEGGQSLPIQGAPTQWTGATKRTSVSSNPNGISIGGKAGNPKITATFAASISLEQSQSSSQINHVASKSLPKTNDGAQKTDSTVKTFFNSLVGKAKRGLDAAFQKQSLPRFEKEPLRTEKESLKEVQGGNEAKDIIEKIKKDGVKKLNDKEIQILTDLGDKKPEIAGPLLKAFRSENSKLFDEFLGKLNTTQKGKIFNGLSNELEKILQDPAKVGNELKFIGFLLDPKVFSPQVDPKLFNQNIDLLRNFIKTNPELGKKVIDSLPDKEPDKVKSGIQNRIEERNNNELKALNFLDEVSKNPNQVSNEDKTVLKTYFEGKSIEQGIDKLVELAKNEATRGALFQVLDTLEAKSPVIPLLFAKLDNKTALDLTKTAFADELKKNKEKGTFFRGTSVASKFVTQLHLKLLNPIVKLEEIFENLQNDYKIDETQKNAQKKLEDQNRFIKDLGYAVNELKKLTGSEKFPSEIKELTQFVKEEVEAKWPGNGETFASQFFILRFFNPQLLGHEGRIGNHKGGISKAIQNLANKQPNEKEKDFFFYNEHIKEGSPIANTFNEVVANLKS